MNTPRQNLVLVGFTSTGKSTTGRYLAKKLGWRFVDLDDIVETIHIEDLGVKRQCREIFTLFGRECFVNYEKRALTTLFDTHRAVIATGGGTPMDEVNRSLTRSLGYVIYLNAQVSAIFNRMAQKGFPQYLDLDPTLADLNRLWRDRHAVYSEIADLVIDNTDKSPEATAEVIIAHLEQKRQIRTS
jgi:shikimate kinase